VIAWGDSSFYSAAEWEAILALLQEGGDFVTDLAPPSAAAQSALEEATAAVLALVRRLPAGLGPSIDRLLRLTILAVPGPQAQAARQGFGGATAFFLRGASVIHASPGLTLPGLLERLVHEAAHAELFVLAQDGPLCHNPDDERHPVRIRPDPRPMNGILHSLHVTGRVCETLDALLANGFLASGFSGHHEPALLLEDCQRLREQQAELGHSSLAAVRRHGRLTALGQAVCEAGARRLAGTTP
jgi:HEXXH motif-containing protein